MNTPEEALAKLVAAFEAKVDADAAGDSFKDATFAQLRELLDPALLQHPAAKMGALDAFAAKNPNYFGNVKTNEMVPNLVGVEKGKNKGSVRVVVNRRTEMGEDIDPANQMAGQSYTVCGPPMMTEKSMLGEGNYLAKDDKRRKDMKDLQQKLYTDEMVKAEQKVEFSAKTHKGVAHTCGSHNQWNTAALLYLAFVAQVQNNIMRFVVANYKWFPGLVAQQKEKHQNVDKELVKDDPALNAELAVLELKGAIEHAVQPAKQAPPRSLSTLLRQLELSTKVPVRHYKGDLTIVPLKEKVLFPYIAPTPADIETLRNQPWCPADPVTSALVFGRPVAPEELRSKPFEERDGYAISSRGLVIYYLVDGKARRIRNEAAAMYPGSVAVPYCKFTCSHVTAGMAAGYYNKVESVKTMVLYQAPKPVWEGRNPNEYAADGFSSFAGLFAPPPPPSLVRQATEEPESSPPTKRARAAATDDTGVSRPHHFEVPDDDGEW